MLVQLPQQGDLKKLSQSLKMTLKSLTLPLIILSFGNFALG